MFVLSWRKRKGGSLRRNFPGDHQEISKPKRFSFLPWIWKRWVILGLLDFPGVQACKQIPNDKLQHSINMAWKEGILLLLCLAIENNLCMMASIKKISLLIQAFKVIFLLAWSTHAFMNLCMACDSKRITINKD